MPEQDVALLISEIQLLMSEKRTALSLMRTGIAIFVLPLSVLSVLIATSRYYSVRHVLPWLVVTMLINAALTVLAVYLIVRALKRLHALDRLINDLKRRSKSVSELVA